MDSASYVIAKPTWFQRWRRGWIIFARTILFQIWIAIYSIPTLLLSKLVDFHHGPLVAIYLLIVLVNLPLAYCLASETTGYFRSKREQHDEPPPFPD
jgi:hypothetical protein